MRQTTAVQEFHTYITNNAGFIPNYGERYRHELGAHYFDERRRHYTVDRLAQRIERLGYRVHLEPAATTAA